MLTRGSVSKLQLEFPKIEFKLDHLLAPYTYFKIGGPAKIFAEARNKEELKNLAVFCAKQEIPFIVLGGGSNVLVSDKGIDKLVIKNSTKQFNLHKHENGAVVQAESGLSVNILVRKTIDESLEGLEFFMGLPGTVGGAVYNNAHFTDQLIGDHLIDVEIVDNNGEMRILKKEELEFSYDYSRFQKTQEVVLSASFFLRFGDKKLIEERALVATKKRATTQPIGQPSSGCMFQNHYRNGEVIFAGKLIDQAGLKGTKIGDAMVSDKHANFIVNLGKATSEDVDLLADKVQDIVQKKFGIKLKREVFSIS